MVEIVLVVLGIFFIFGGWVVGPSGDVILIFPYWLYVFGFTLVTIALYLYVMNLQLEKRP
ncbi:MAG: hypothetical protein IH630_01950 [Thermoplasmata archaeon]|nr:hypothetical protein [Thermoplasmata archaeon]